MSCSSATINEESPTTTATARSKFQNPRPVQQAIQSMTLNPSRLSRFSAESSNNKGESAAVAELKRSFTQNSIKRMAAAFTNKGRLISMEQEESSSSSSSSDEPSSSHHESTTTSPTSSSSSRDYESISSSSVDCSSLCQKQPSQLAQINKKIASSSSLLSNYSADSSRNTSSNTSSNTNQVIMTFLLTAAYLYEHPMFRIYLNKYSDIFHPVTAFNIFIQPSQYYKLPILSLFPIYIYI